MSPARTIIIGDVHGMTQELRALIAEVDLARADRLVLAGDLLDKGPDSAGTVKFLRGLREDGFDVTLVKGNHEEKHERYRHVITKVDPDKVKMKGVEELRVITEALSPKDVAFLDTAVLFHRIPEHGAVVVHGGITPLMESLDDLSKKDIAALLRVRYVKGVTTRKVTVEFTVDGDGTFNIPDLMSRARATRPVSESVRTKGDFLALGEETEADPFWADVYGTDERGPRFGHVYFGHSPFIGTEPARFPHATGLDTGAVFGGSLTAAVLVPGQEPSFVSVQASGKYATSLWEQ